MRRSQEDAEPLPGGGETRDEGQGHVLSPAWANSSGPW